MKLISKLKLRWSKVIRKERNKTFNFKTIDCQWRGGRFHQRSQCSTLIVKMFSKEWPRTTLNCLIYLIQTMICSGLGSFFFSFLKYKHVSLSNEFGQPLEWDLLSYIRIEGIILEQAKKSRFYILICSAILKDISLFTFFPFKNLHSCRETVLANLGT